MNKAPDFDELVGNDLPAEDRDRLLRAHELLIAAGPPPELPPGLAHPPEPERNVSYLPQRRRFTVIGVAAAAVLAAFGVGFLAGGRSSNEFAGSAVRPMHGTALAPAARATIRIADADKAGNWPMRVSIRGLARLHDGAYYELYFSKNGKPFATCGTFTVHAGTTVVELNAPYQIRRFSGWVVTRHERQTRGDGPIVMTT